MATIQEEILDAFFAKLRESADIDEEGVEALRALFTAGGKLKAEDLVAVYLAANKDGAM